MSFESTANWPPTRVAATARSMTADRAAAEIMTAFARAGIRSILLRGPSIARHLYEGDIPREYGDADLLVPPGLQTRAEEILHSRGFADETGLGRRPDDQIVWSTAWTRSSDGANVDLHQTIVGVRGESETVWRLLSDQVESVEVARSRVDGLDATATALVVGLHAAQHGVGFMHPLNDLALALEKFPEPIWDQATRLAEQLEATEALAAGLRLLPAGVQLAARLRLPSALSTETLLRVRTPPPMALGFDWFARTSGLRPRLRLIVGKAVPEVRFMRVWFPPARGGSSLGLALGYLWRPLWLLWHSVPALRAWIVARRATRTSSAADR